MELASLGSPMRVVESQLSFTSEMVECEPQNLPLVVFGGLEDELDRSPLSCEPLCQVLPLGSLLLTVADVKAVGGVEKSPKSKWVDNHMSGFSKYVGFPIDEFETECLALFWCIEESWNQQKSQVGKALVNFVIWFPL